MPIFFSSKSAAPSPLRKLGQRAARRALTSGWQVQFSAMHPALVWQALRSQQFRRSLPAWHNRIIRGLFFETGGWYTGFSALLQADEVVIVEEGLAQRAVNLFAWSNGDLDERAVDDYLAYLPQVDLTVVVRAPLERCLERAAVRGLPIRLREKDLHTVRRFIEQSARVADRIEPVLSANGRRVVVVNNHAGLDEAVSDLLRKVSGSELFPGFAWQPEPAGVLAEEAAA
jgi:hypothetical protein